MTVCVLSRIRLFVTPWTIARQAPRSMEFSRHEYWSGLPFSSSDINDYYKFIFYFFPEFKLQRSYIALFSLQFLSQLQRI